MTINGKFNKGVATAKKLLRKLEITNYTIY